MKIFPQLAIAITCATALFAEGDSVINYSTTGTVYPQHRCTVMAQVSGKVEKINVDVGDTVSAKQDLLVLDKTFFTIDVAQKKAKVQESSVQLQDAKLNYNRMKKLWEKPTGAVPAISQKRFEDAKVHYQEAIVKKKDASEELKRAQANFDEASIKAPFAGIIAKRFVDVGETVSSLSTKLFEVEDVSTVFVEFSLPQRALKDVSVGTFVTIECSDTALEPFTVGLDRIFPNVDENTRSIRCRASVSTKEHPLFPGTLVHVTLTKEQK